VTAKLYLDGCSMTHGHGLSKNQTLGYLFEHRGDYQTKDLSRNGKSNLAIAIDAWNNYNNYDVFVLGFTYSSRFYINYQGHNLDFYSGFQNQHLLLDHTVNTQEINHAFVENFKYFYTVFESPFCDELSDCIIDGIISFLKSQNKKVLAFTWESRNTKNKLLAPYIAPHYRLSDGHLNEQGTQYLFDMLQNELGKLNE
jgi:hypothetical protein